MSVEQTRKYFLEKYGIDIDKVEKVVIEPKEQDRDIAYYNVGNDKGNSSPFSPQPHNPIRTSGKKPTRQKENVFLD